MKIISLDIEATDHGEMLELSIVSCEDLREIYHSYFRPERDRNWPVSEKIHHITPAMVRTAPSVRKERAKIETLLRGADALLGFAIENDVKYLEDNGVHIPDSLRIVEARDWFWMYKGKNEGIEMNAVPSLSKCAEMLDFEFSEETDAHSATNDTVMTIRLFDRILSIAGVERLGEEKLSAFDAEFGKEKERFARESAAGVITLMPDPKGFRLKNNSLRHTDQKEQKEGTYAVEVESRFLAEHEIREKFKKRETAPESGIYRLRPADIEWFGKFSNTYDAGKEEFYRHIYGRRGRRKLGGAFKI